MHDSALRERAATATYPLTAVQHSMLLDSLVAAQEGAYIQQLVCTLREELNVSLFRNAWRRLLERHAVLRTSFSVEDENQPVQLVHDQVDWELEESDWTYLDILEKENRLAACLREDRRRGFALELPPLWRLHLIRMEENDYRLLWTSHHALFDGRSRAILLKELFALYEASLFGTELPLDPPRPFEDHVRRLDGHDFSASQAYWRELLHGFSGATPLPERKARKCPDDGHLHQTLQVELSDALTGALENLARESDVTLNTILQGAWALILSLYSRTADVVFGATRACRHTSVTGAKAMVGLFINTLPVRVRIRSSASVRDWLQELRAQWVAMRDQEQTPLSLVRGWSEVPPGEPLFESIVVFEKRTLEEDLRAHGGNWENRSVRLLGITNYPLVVAGYGGKRLRIELTFDRRRFAEDTILGIRDRLQILLEEIAGDRPHAGPLPAGGGVSGRTLAELPMISPGERQQLLFDWNATTTTIPRDQSVAQLFEAQAARTPGAVALVFGNERWTYAELNVRANQLAHRLRAMGVGLETPVAIGTERSPEMVAGILGILKAGGAYVPLDLTDSHERIAFILRDTQAPVILTERSLVSTLPLDGIDILPVDGTLEEGGRNADTANLPCPATFESLAYIMYTSGSTGTPKGVAVPHRGIIRLIFGIDYVALDASRKILHLASPVFDASTFELWAALLHGGQCILFPGQVPALDVLERVVRDHQVDTLFLTTALFHAIIDESAGILSGVQQLLVGGDVLSVDHVRRALSALPETSIINAYGPTETTTFATSYRVPRDVADDASSIPIGMPIGNTSVYLLDPLGRLVPPGVPGELYIGGPGVARSYWNQPELTAERFRPDQFDTQSGTHLYRTGDLGRRLPDGNIEFLGRLDGQVKIRGFRIELGEIETALRRHPEVRDTVVIATEELGSMGRRLVAYVVLRPDGPTPSVNDLRRFLKTFLPGYMLPSAFVVLDELPLTSNGKVDRRGLVAADLIPADPGDVVTARTPVEAKLIEIFAGLLGRDQVGINDDFFELGGHSLLAMKAVSRARQAFGVALPLGSFFEEPTVAGLAESVAALIQTGSDERAQPICRVPRTGIHPLLPSQLSIWGVYRRYPGKTMLNPSRAYRLGGPLSVEALREALAALVERHEALRTNFVEIDGVAVQIVRPAGRLDLPLVDLSDLPEAARLADAQRLFDDETRHHFNLADGSLFRPRLLRLSSDDHVLILIFSHIIMDGWSLGLFLRELSACYQAFTNGGQPALPALPFQPVDIACWERQFLQGAEAQRQIAWWRNHLASSTPAKGLAGDGPELEPGDFLCVHESLVIPAHVVEGLQELGRQEGCTLSTTLLAAANALLYEATGQHDIRVNIPVTARTRPELEGLIGCFRRRLILCTDVSGNPTFRQLLVRVKDVSNAGFRHQDVSLETVFPERGRDHPAYWTNIHMAFNFLHGADEIAGPLKLPGISISTLERSQYYSRSILDMSIFEKETGIVVLLRSMQEMFSAAAIQGLLEQYEALLRRVMAAPDQKLSVKKALLHSQSTRQHPQWNS
jgi:amino acid adenylation domain-containing protein